MGVLAKMVVTSKTENWGPHYPPEHFDDDHYGQHFIKNDAGENTGLKDCDCMQINEGVGGVEVIMRPVYSTEPGHPNHQFWSATPSGELKLQINNPAASSQFEVGVEYFMEIRKARK